ncbi:hypothetical protein SNE40_002748 [Patella caerulea]|uniref:Uncharacterized protein n=1 Tax=Patella caerulea TaxID=87958 RepID=A0AAN8PZK8_PATCE
MAKLILLSILLFTVAITTISGAESNKYTDLSKRTKEVLRDSDFDSALKYFLSSLKNKVLRDRRGSVDFGLMSRHLAGSDYARVAETRHHILDPYGPGKRKWTL